MNSNDSAWLRARQCVLAGCIATQAKDFIAACFSAAEVLGLPISFKTITGTFLAATAAPDGTMPVTAAELPQIHGEVVRLMTEAMLEAAIAEPAGKDDWFSDLLEAVLGTTGSRNPN